MLSTVLEQLNAPPSVDQQKSNPINSQLKKKKSNFLKMMQTLMKPKPIASQAPPPKQSKDIVTDDKIWKVEDILYKLEMASIRSQDKNKNKENRDNNK